MAQNATEDGRTDMEVVDSILENVSPKKNVKDGVTGYVDKCSADKLPNGRNY